MTWCQEQRPSFCSQCLQRASSSASSCHCFRASLGIRKKSKPGQQQILGVWICYDLLTGVGQANRSSLKAITEEGAAWSNTCRVLFAAIQGYLCMKYKSQVCRKGCTVHLCNQGSCSCLYIPYLSITMVEGEDITLSCDPFDLCAHLWTSSDRA